jgi:uncharacterized small protein (DUF1192 family)
MCVCVCALWQVAELTRRVEQLEAEADRADIERSRQVIQIIIQYH